MPFSSLTAQTEAMQLSANPSARETVPNAAVSSPLNTIRLDLLQSAVRNNQVSFPSQVPVFVKHAPPDMQCRFVLLYFVRGLSCQDIARRYGFARNYVWQVVNEWRRHAVSLGFIQEIPPMPAYPMEEFMLPLTLPANAALEHSPAA